MANKYILSYFTGKLMKDKMCQYFLSFPVECLCLTSLVSQCVPPILCMVMTFLVVDLYGIPQLQTMSYAIWQCILYGHFAVYIFISVHSTETL